MFGQNEVTNTFLDPDGSLLVHSIWKTIQGEGPDAGRPAVFIRLAKCNLRCSFCDTEFDHGTQMQVADIIDEVRRVGREGAEPSLAVITGGEPLLQNILPLTDELFDRFAMAVAVETAGTVSMPGLTQFFRYDRSYRRNLIVCSPKTPKVHPDIVECCGAWKYVVSATDEIDEYGIPITATQIGDVRPAPLFRPRHILIHDNIYLQPMDERDPVKNANNLARCVELCLAHDHRLSIQVHKLAGVD